MYVCMDSRGPCFEKIEEDSPGLSVVGVDSPIHSKVRDMNTKAKGNRAEHRCMRMLEAQGFQTTRSSASLGAWDVIAVGPDGVRLVQVKCNRRPGRVEMETLRAFKVPPSGVSKEVWVFKDGKPREPIITFLNSALVIPDRVES